MICWRHTISSACVRRAKDTCLILSGGGNGDIKDAEFRSLSCLRYSKFIDLLAWLQVSRYRSLSLKKVHRRRTTPLPIFVLSGIFKENRVDDFTCILTRDSFYLATCTLKLLSLTSTRNGLFWIPEFGEIISTSSADQWWIRHLQQCIV